MSYAYRNSEAIQEIIEGLVTPTGKKRYAIQPLKSLASVESTWGGREFVGIQFGPVRSSPPPNTALFVFGHHGDEFVPPEIGYHLAKDLYEACIYDRVPDHISYTPHQIRAMLDNINVIIVPVVNPDGRDTALARCRETGRKNGHGVDLNRNYDFTFDYHRYYDPRVFRDTPRRDLPPQLGLDSLLSVESSENYQGPEAFSEPESRNVRQLIQSIPSIHWFVDVHSFGQAITPPFGDARTQTTHPEMNWRNPVYDGQRGVGPTGYGDHGIGEYMSPRSFALIRQFGNALKRGIGRATPYNVRSAYVTGSPRVGTSKDWVASYHLFDPTRAPIVSFTLEVGTTFNPFTDSDVRQEINQVVGGLLRFCMNAAGITVDT